jgi:hypothetical protein
MSQQGATESAGGVHPGDAVRTSISKATVRFGSLALAFLFAAVLTVVRIVRNAPVEVPSIGGTATVLLPAVLVVAGLGAVVVGLTTASAAERIVLVFGGVFAVLTAVDPRAGVPATGAVVASGVVLVGRDARRHATSPRRLLVGGLVLAGLAASLTAALGVAAATLRPLGTTLALLGLAATPLLVAPSQRAWLAGGLAAGGILAAGLSAPFVTGAVTLVTTAAVGGSLPLLALGVGGATTTGVRLLGTDERAAALGVGLLILAGVPATVPRATLVVLGLAVLLGGDPR